MDKKAEGMSINVIIIAIIALIVLLVVVLVFSGKMGDIIPSLDQSSCQARSGTCISKEAACENDGMKAIGMGCPGEDQAATLNYCCYPKPENK